MHARTPLPACGLCCSRWVSWVPATRSPDTAWTPRVTPRPHACPRGSAGRHPRFPGERVGLAGHRQARTSRSQPARTCCVLKSQPRQQRRPARSAMALGVPAARLCVVWPAAVTVSPRSDTQGRRGLPLATPRRTLAWSHEAGLHSGATCGTTWGT